MKKVMLITNHSYMFWRFRRELVQCLMKKNEVVLLTPFVGHEQDFMDMGIRCINTPIDRRGINPVKDYSLLKMYEHILSEERPDIVVTYSIKPNIYAGLCCEKLNIPYFANVQGLGTAFEVPVLCDLVSFLYKKAFTQVKGVFFENEKDAKVFVDKKIINQERITVLKGAGINTEIFSYCEYPENEKIHFLYVGRFMKEKGMDELIEASKRLYQEGHAFVLDLVGFCEDSYEDKIKELETMHIAVNHGFQNSVKDFYNRADCVVLPSYHEGMSNVLLEGASVGRPLITSDVSGCKETVVDGETGFLVKVQDTEELYLTMKKFLVLPIEKRREMGILGRKKMEREFKKEIILDETMRVLESLKG